LVLNQETVLQDKWKALFRADVVISPQTSGALDGLTFAVKEAFDVAGTVTAAGNPDWIRTHTECTSHADVIGNILEAGATLKGKTHTDELMFSLNGENAHFGTPINPRAPDRVPGGSSSGSAVAVAAGLTDFALGTDTGGSVRIPSSYCGIYGIRPTHGRLSKSGVLQLAPSFCTVGWMAPSSELLSRVGRVLLDASQFGQPSGFSRCVIASDALMLVEAGVREPFLRAGARFQEAFDQTLVKPMSPEGLELWMWAFRIVQGREVWRTHGAWIESVKPRFGPGVAERFAWTKTLDAHVEKLAQRIRDHAREALADMLGDDTVIMLPTAPGPAPRLNMEEAMLSDWRARALQLTCIAGLAGLPQVTIPCFDVDGLPVGLSFIAPHGQDERLLDWIAQMESNLPTVDAAFGS